MGKGHKRSPERGRFTARRKSDAVQRLLWVRGFDTVEELRIALHAWMHQYNAHWLIERNGYLTPNQARLALLPAEVAA